MLTFSTLTHSVDRGNVRKLFQRSEFLMPTCWVTPQYRATSKKKFMYVCSKNLSVCSTNLGFIGGSAYRYCCRTLRQYDTRYVLCTRYVCTWYQPAEIYTYVRYVFVFVSPFQLQKRVLPALFHLRCPSQSHERFARGRTRLTTVTSISCRSL